MSLLDKQILPPQSWEQFEEITLQLFRKIWGDPLAKKNGRRGFPQHGTDVYGRPNRSSGPLHGLQCKGKDQLYGAEVTRSEYLEELAKAEDFSPWLGHWALLTTAPKNPDIEVFVRKLSQERQNSGLFPVDYLGWEDIRSLFVECPEIITQHYPGVAFDLEALVAKIEQLPSKGALKQFLQASKATTNIQFTDAWRPGSWLRLDFNNQRNIAAALSGRPLGHLDVAACPQTTEVDAAVRQLRESHCVRIYGLPGDGKSVCSQQILRKFWREGWKVFQLSDSSRLPLAFSEERIGIPAIFFIDDAHLASEAALSSLELRTSDICLLVSALTISEERITARGSITINAKRAVKTLASYCRENQGEILPVVKTFDDWVGTSITQEDLGRRIDDAENSSDRPWQFAFILSGGWRRANRFIDAAVENKACLTLFLIALHQLASRDQRTDRSRLKRFSRLVGQDESEFDKALTWLIRERLVCAEADLRCPHQRFSAAVVSALVDRYALEGENCYRQLIQYILQDVSFSLPGLQQVVHEIRFLRGSRKLTRGLLDRDTVQHLVERALTANTENERLYAALLLNDFDGFTADWIDEIVNPNIQLIANWCCEARGDAGYGLGRLLNNVNNSHKGTLASIAEKVDTPGLAKTASSITKENAYAIGSLVRPLAALDTDWCNAFLSNLDVARLKATAENWPVGEKLYGFAEFCEAIASFDNDLAVELVDAGSRSFAAAISNDPLRIANDLRDVLWFVLRVSDPLGVFTGALRPSTKHKAVARRLCEQISPQSASARLASMTARDFQDAWMFLDFVMNARPAAVKAIIDEFDWHAFEELLKTEICDLQHEGVNFVTMLFRQENAREKLTTIFTRLETEIQVFSPRLALCFPAVAIKVIENGGQVALSREMTFGWKLVSIVIKMFGHYRADLLDKLINPHETDASKAFERDQANTYEGVDIFVQTMRKHSPEALQRIINKIDPTLAEKAWRTCLRSKEKNSAAALIDQALSANGPLTDIANKLRREFPSASIPKKVDLGF